VDYILKDENAIYYECGFSCDNAIFIAVGGESFFITDARYTTEAKEHVKGAEVVEARDLVAQARRILRRLRVPKIAYDPKEFDCKSLTGLRKGVTTQFHPSPDLSWKRRAIKSPEEIELIRRSAQLNREAFHRFGEYLVQEGEGKSERELRFAAQEFLTRRGLYDLSFEPIVALNGNAAKPHAHPSSLKLSRGDLILFDGGIRYERYCSDRTRTALFGEGFHWGKDQSFSDPLIQRAYDVVRRAQEAAIEGARSGMEAREIDALARDIVERSEFRGRFVHSLGHGVGLDIHEMPFINSRNRQIIEDGMVFTIEPGIYIPGAFGIRIEDMVYMDSGRAELLP